MNDQDSLISNKKANDADATNDSKQETVNDGSHFSIETEEEMNETEKERWRRDAKKYEELIDKLFDEDDDQSSAEE